MKKNFLTLGILLAFLFISSESFATHFRYGTITYEVLSETGSGSAKQTTVKFTVNQGWRRSFFGSPAIGGTVNSGTFYFGDGTNTSTSLTVTAINFAEDWFLGTFTTTKVYTGNVDRTAYMSNCCRISSLQGGNANDYYRNEAVVTLSQTTNENPVSSLPAIVNVPINQAAYKFNLNAIDPNGDAITYTLSSFSQSSLSPNNPAIFTSINSATGEVTLNSSYAGANVGHLWAIQFMMTDSKGATSPIDFIIRVAGTSNPPGAISPTPANGTTYKVTPGTPVNFTIAASDLDVADVVTLLGSGIPIGATFNPGTPANPISAGFSWTPTQSDLGTYAVTFSATDGNFAQSLTTINIFVSNAPAFDIPPTPATSTHLIVEPGNNISFTVKATDPDPTDQCQITSVMGKNHMGNPIPIYAGVLLSPSIPTTAGNSTQTAVNWTPTMAQWGHRHMFFTATDGFNDQTTHEISILVNTPPSFSSVAPTTACVGQPFVYNVVTTDLDMPQGDSIDLFAINMPSWMTFVDNGDGTGTLSGTPGAGDVGLLNMSLSAQDVHHHNNGETIQYLSINVLTVCGAAPPACPSPFSVAITPLGVNTNTWGSAVSDPYTFYFGLSQWKKLKSSVTGGVGPFTYDWGTITSGQIKNRGSNPKNKYLFQPMSACKVYLNVTDQATNCTYGDTIDIQWNDDYFCGTIAANGNISYALEICQGGITKCVPWKTGITALKAKTATLGACPPAKRQLGSTLNFKVYPNPTSDLINISYAAVKNGKGSIRLMDSRGSILTSESINVNEGNFVHTIDASQYQSGLYLVHLEIDGEVFVERVVIQ
jgi:hypothetical protein